MRRVIIGVGVVLVALVVILVWPAQTPAVAPLPNPNGYDDFVKAGTLATILAQDYRQVSLGELRLLTATNAEALRLLRVGLARDCRIPVDYSVDYFTRHQPEVISVRKLAWAVMAEGRLAELEQRTNDAARPYLDAIHLGQEAARGGLVFDHMTGVSCEKMSAEALEHIVPCLNAAQCRATIAELDSIAVKRETADEIIRSEQTWSRRTYGLRAQLVLKVMSRSWNPGRYSYQRFLQARRQSEIDRQVQLRLDLATRAFELEKGRSPTNSLELVPAYLKALSTPANPRP